jgi:RNA polymerase-binding transcription factor DksA
MAKKVQKAKPAKKAAKPAKKAAAKSKPVKKAAPKKASKPVKKAAAKPAAKKAVKPAKKAVKKPAPAKKAAKKPAQKVVAKKPVKKAAPAKKAAPKKVAAKKPVAKKVVKAAPAKKAAKAPAKKAAAPAKTGTLQKALKTVAKQVVQKVVKTVAKIVEAKPLPAKPVETPKPVAKKPEPKKKERMDLDDDGRSSRHEAPMIVEYRSPAIRKPMGPAPKPHVNTDTRTRYSDAELKEFKQLILKKLEDAQKDYELLKSTLSHKDDHGTDDTSPTFKLLEDGSDVLSKEETAHLASRQEKFIQNLQNALIRIENKTYGICRATGKLISKERLRSVPHATLAIEAKLEQNN